jgi:NAD(P)-dependent dehydrogenase (short-subunit alcohol dehydrogenase family)
MTSCQENGRLVDKMTRRAHGEDMKLDDTASLVTGASRGLGLALARRLAAAGSRVVLVARSEGPLLDAVAAIRAAGGEAHAVVGDVAAREAIHAIAGQAAALVGPIDVAIQNASTLGPTPLRLLLDTACEDLAAVLETNLLGPFRLGKILAGSMALRGRGVIVQISSDAAVEAYPRWGAYAVSKAALDHLGRVWAAELEGTGVRVIDVDPGEMDTVMHRDAMPEADPATLARPDDVAARIVAMIRDEAGAPSGSRQRALADAWRGVA